MILSLPEVFTWENVKDKVNQECSLLYFFEEDSVSKHLSGFSPDLDGDDPYTVEWWEIRCYHVYIGKWFFISQFILMLENYS